MSEFTNINNIFKRDKNQIELWAKREISYNRKDYKIINSRYKKEEVMRIRELRKISKMRKENLKSIKKQRKIDEGDFLAMFGKESEKYKLLKEELGRLANEFEIEKNNLKEKLKEEKIEIENKLQEEKIRIENELQEEKIKLLKGEMNLTLFNSLEQLYNNNKLSIDELNKKKMISIDELNKKKMISIDELVEKENNLLKQIEIQHRKKVEQLIEKIIFNLKTIEEELNENCERIISLEESSLQTKLKEYQKKIDDLKEQLNEMNSNNEISQNQLNEVQLKIDEENRLIEEEKMKIEIKKVELKKNINKAIQQDINKSSSKLDDLLDYSLILSSSTDSSFENSLNYDENNLYRINITTKNQDLIVTISEEKEIEKFTQTFFLIINEDEEKIFRWKSEEKDNVGNLCNSLIRANHLTVEDNPAISFSGSKTFRDQKILLPFSYQPICFTLRIGSHQFKVFSFSEKKVYDSLGHSVVALPKMDICLERFSFGDSSYFHLGNSPIIASYFNQYINNDSKSNFHFLSLEGHFKKINLLVLNKKKVFTFLICSSKILKIPRIIRNLVLLKWFSFFILDLN